MKYIFRNNGYWLEFITPKGETFWMPLGADVRTYLAKGFKIKEEIEEQAVPQASAETKAPVEKKKIKKGE